MFTPNYSKFYFFTKNFLNKCKNIRYLSAGQIGTIQKPSYLHFTGKDPLVYRNIGQQLEHTVQAYGDTEAIVSCHEGLRYTFSAIRDKADQLSAAFLKIGLKRGDAIGIWAPNNIHWYLTMVAAARAGLVSVGINPAFQGPEIEYCLNKVNVKAIVAAEMFKTQNYYEILESVIPEVRRSEAGKICSERIPSIKSIIIDSKDKLPGTFRFNDLFELPTNDDVRGIQLLQNTIQPDSPCNIQFTSGTTGGPKAAVLSHFNFVNNGIHVANRNELKNQRICVPVPLFHAYGVLISCMAGMIYGTTLVLPDAGHNPEASLRAIVNEKCSIIYGTPTMHLDLITKQKELNLPIADWAKIALTGGSPCSPQLYKDIKNTLGVKKIKNVFGMTETTAVVFQSLTEESDDLALQTVGHIQDHIEAKVIDHEGNIVPFGQPGELCIRGYLNMLEYFGDADKTREMIGEDRWLKTGDQFILQENGYGKIVGRIKEMIIRGGENIFPKEIEDFLYSHPDILEVHVIGVPDERLGEEVCAFMRLKNGVKTITQTQIKEFCKGKIAHFKIPKYVNVITEFPKTTSGKIQKFKLRELFIRSQKN